MLRLSATLATLLACSASTPHVEPAPVDAHRTHPEHAGQAAHAKGSDDLEAVRVIHGGAGPWVVAGYRMGRFAIKELGLPPGSFDVEVSHHSPREVQWSCIADGAAAATGASLGKLNLSLTEAPPAETRTVYRNRVTGKSITLVVAPSFRERYANVPREHLEAAGREVLALPDEQIFSVMR